MVDYATKVCLATAITGTSTARDAIESIELAIAEAERLTALPVAEDCLDPLTAEPAPCVIVTDIQSWWAFSFTMVGRPWKDAEVRLPSAIAQSPSGALVRLLAC